MSKNNDSVIDGFVDTLVQDKGITDLEPEVIDQLKADLKERLNNRVNAAILAKMPPEQLDAFEQKMKDGSDEDVDSFIASQIPDLQEVIAQELLAFRATYLYP